MSVMMDNLVVTATVVRITRKRSSKEGNPRWALDTTSGVFVTERNSASGYAVTEQMLGRQVNLSLTRSGEVSHIEVV